MLRIPVQSRKFTQSSWLHRNSSSSSIRRNFIDFFVNNHKHKYVKSSSVVPLCDPTVPFVNAGMNQFKGVFLGTVDSPYPRVVNSQKCIRVGGKHNDLDIVGTDGHHHTFFEMLGNWSFGDYYKKEACQMAWDLLLGPYRIKPESLLVTYFAGDPIIGLLEDRECRDIWKDIGVPVNRLKALGAKDNFWEMGLTGPCGPCTEIHYIKPDGSLTEIWNLVFIQCNRESDGTVKGLSRQHVDTGMGLERMAALLQGVPSNYDTDLFQPLIRAIQQNSKGVENYKGQYEVGIDCEYRRLADHMRMISVSLADGAFPASSLNLKQIMRKVFKVSADVFKNPKLPLILYDEVATSLGPTYPELRSKERDAKLVIEHEQHAYEKMRGNLAKKWRELVQQYPEVDGLEVESAGFVLGYRELKEIMSKQNSTLISGELVFKLYDTHGFQEDVIQRIADLNNYTIDNEGFQKLLAKHKTRHKTAFKEQTSNKGVLFDKTIDKLVKSGVLSTNDRHKYDYQAIDNEIIFKPLTTKVVAILDEDGEWLDYLEPCENRPYYLVTEDTNFYCEEGGQAADTGIIRLNKDVYLKVDNVFKIRDFIFHKGCFVLNKNSENMYVKCNSDVTLEFDSVRRLNIMKNHTTVHLLNAAIRKVLPNSVVCPIGSSVTEKGLYLNLSVYGDKLSQKVVLEAQDLIRQSIKANAPLETSIIDSVQASSEASLVTVPGETYPETGLRMVTVSHPLQSKELCCGTHVPSTGFIEEFCVTLVKGAGGHTPTIHALTGVAARQARELFCRAEKLEEVISLADPECRKVEVSSVKRELAQLCGGGGAPYGEYAECLNLLDNLMKRPVDKNDMAMHAIAETEVSEALQEACRLGRRFLVQFVRSSYLMQPQAVRRLVGSPPVGPTPTPTLLLGCAQGVIVAAAQVPEEVMTESFTAQKWLSCILPVFNAEVMAASTDNSLLTYAEMTGTKVSLINCEQLVQDAMRIAIKFAQSHLKDLNTEHTQSRRHNS